MTSKTYAYFQDIGYREPKILKSLRAKTENLPGSHMQIAPETGQFLGFLIQVMGAKRVLEIGTFRGYSTLWMALSLPQEGRIITCDVDEFAYEIAKPFWNDAGISSKIDFKLGPALETLTLLHHQRQEFDFIFIDADKKNYQEYYELSMSLLKPGGVIAIDNTLGYQGAYLPDAQTSAAKSIDTLNQHLYQDPRITLSLLPVGDGLTLVFKTCT